MINVKGLLDSQTLLTQRWVVSLKYFSHHLEYHQLYL